MIKKKTSLADILYFIRDICSVLLIRGEESIKEKMGMFIAVIAILVGITFWLSFVGYGIFISATGNIMWGIVLIALAYIISGTSILFLGSIGISLVENKPLSRVLRESFQGLYGETQ